MSARAPLLPEAPAKPLRGKGHARVEMPMGADKYALVYNLGWRAHCATLRRRGETVWCLSPEAAALTIEQLEAEDRRRNVVRDEVAGGSHCDAATIIVNGMVRLSTGSDGPVLVRVVEAHQGCYTAGRHYLPNRQWPGDVGNVFRVEPGTITIQGDNGEAVRVDFTRRTLDPNGRDDIHFCKVHQVGNVVWLIARPGELKVRDAAGAQHAA